MIQFYVMPRAGDSSTPEGALPKYLTAAQKWRTRYFGDQYVVEADVTPAEHADITAHADVIVLGDQDATVGQRHRNGLKALGFPVDGFTGTTIRDLLAFLNPVIDVEQAFIGAKSAKERLDRFHAAVPVNAPDMTAFLDARKLR
jgi:hypothetical protein